MFNACFCDRNNVLCTPPLAALRHQLSMGMTQRLPTDAQSAGPILCGKMCACRGLLVCFIIKVQSVRAHWDIQGMLGSSM